MGVISDALAQQGAALGQAANQTSQAVNQAAPAGTETDWKLWVALVGVVVSIGWNIFNTWNQRRTRQRDAEAEIFKDTISSPLRLILADLDNVNTKVQAIGTFGVLSSEQKQDLQGLFRQASEAITRLKHQCCHLNADNCVCRRIDWDEPVFQHEDKIFQGFETALGALDAGRSEQGFRQISKELGALKAALNGMITEELRKVKAG